MNVIRTLAAAAAGGDARQALGTALTGMLRDGEINDERAAEIARLVLRGNAERLYRFTSGH